MQTIIHAHYLENITFFLTNLHTHLHFYYITILRILFRIFSASCHSHFTRRRLQFKQSKARNFLIVLAKDLVQNYFSHHSSPSMTKLASLPAILSHALFFAFACHLQAKFASFRIWRRFGTWRGFGFF